MGCCARVVSHAQISTSRPQAKHQYGQVDFIEIPEGTKGTWTTRFGVQLPGPSTLIDSAFGVVFGISFRLVLRNVERRALAAQR